MIEAINIWEEATITPIKIFPPVRINIITPITRVVSPTDLKKDMFVLEEK